ncbi:MAG: hypothetical protein GY776_07065 [Alteromonas sp.]|nr:hypothetical protein [Alteromonas sp.]
MQLVNRCFNFVDFDIDEVVFHTEVTVRAKPQVMMFDEFVDEFSNIEELLIQQESEF